MQPQMIADVRESHDVTEAELHELALWVLAHDQRSAAAQQQQEQQRQHQQQFEQQQQLQQQQFYQQQMQYQQQSHHSYAVNQHVGHEDPSAGNGAGAAGAPPNQQQGYPVHQPSHMQQQHPPQQQQVAPGMAQPGYSPYDGGHAAYGMQQHAMMNGGAHPNNPYQQPAVGSTTLYGSTPIPAPSNQWATFSEDFSEQGDQAGLRKGKWTIEEEEYTRRLVQHFNNGLLMIPNDTTLRAFLSNRLKCDRMRITKKFRGICFGRKYKSCDPTQSNMVSMQQAAEELKNLEARFLARDEQEQDKKAAIQEEIDSCLQGTSTVRNRDILRTFPTALPAPGPASGVEGGEAASSVSSMTVEGQDRGGAEGFSEGTDAHAVLGQDLQPDESTANIIVHREQPSSTAQGGAAGSIGAGAQGSQSSDDGMVAKGSEGGDPASISALQARRVANLLDKPSEALLLVLGQKYLAQLKKQARALHKVTREASSLHGNAVDVSPAAGQASASEPDATAMLISSEAVLPTSNEDEDLASSSASSSSTSGATSGDEKVATPTGAGDESTDGKAGGAKRAFSDTLSVDAESASESLEPGKRVKVMACNDTDSDAGKLLLGFFNTVNQKKALRAGGKQDVVKQDAVKKLSELPKQGHGRQVGFF